MKIVRISHNLPYAATAMNGCKAGKVYLAEIVPVGVPFEVVYETSDDQPPARLKDVPGWCDKWIPRISAFQHSTFANDIADIPSIIHPLLDGLRRAVDAMPEAPPAREKHPINYLGGSVWTEAANELKHWRDWAVDALPKPTPQGKKEKRRNGRPSKNEKPSATKVIGALTKHHGYEDGSVTNYEPAENRQLADKYKLAPNALTRFLQSKLGKKDGHKRYVSACTNETIGALLARWNGETLEHRADVRDYDATTDPDEA